MSDNKLMLYQPKEKPTDILKDVCELFSKSYVIDKAYYCMGSILDNYVVSEKNIIGMKVSDNASKEEFIYVNTLCKELSLKYDNLIFVSINKEPFKSYFSNEEPFYK
jgi:hypothetical protein